MSDHYVGIAVFENGNLDGTDLSYSEEIYLVVAEDFDEATTKVTEMAEGDVISEYETANGNQRYQKLLRIVDVNQSLYELSDEGASLYSRRFRSLDAYKEMEMLWEE